MAWNRPKSSLLHGFALGLALAAVLMTQDLPKAWAKGGGSRNDKVFGASLSGNGVPAPSLMSFNFHLNIAGFVRLDAGVGAYSNALANGPRAVYNVTGAPIAAGLVSVIKPLFFAFAWLGDGLDQWLKNWKVSTHLKYDDFWKSASYSSLKSPYLRTRGVFSYGGGSKLFVPGWNFSPTVGINWAHYRTNGGAYGLGNEGQHFYYTGGIDWQTESGFDIGGGFNWCPSIARKACGGYLQLGTFF